MTQLPPDPPADPLDDFDKVLQESREIRERVKQVLHASLDSVLREPVPEVAKAAAADPLSELPSPEMPLPQDLDEPTPA